MFRELIYGMGFIAVAFSGLGIYWGKPLIAAASIGGYAITMGFLFLFLWLASIQKPCLRLKKE